MKHRREPRPRVLRVSRSDGAPYGTPCRSPSKEAIQSRTRIMSSLGTAREPGVGNSSSPPCCVSDGSRGEDPAVSAGGTGIAGAHMGGSTSATWRSPPRVKRVTTHKIKAAALPNVAPRSNASRRLRRRQEGEQEVEPSSCSLAAAIGCRPVNYSAPAAANEAGWAADQNQDPDHNQNGRADKTGSSLFRMGLDLGQKRFRGAGVA